MNVGFHEPRSACDFTAMYVLNSVSGSRVPGAENTNVPVSRIQRLALAGQKKANIIRAQCVETEKDAMNTERQIIKYSNRRLYDTCEARYVTLADIRKLVLDETGFWVWDRNTGLDITDHVLLQVLVDQERNSEPVMHRDQLLRIIRSCSGASSLNVIDSSEGAPESLRVA
jgi:polyhydroxyalkanoate synthesis repressor PhaR